MIRDLLLLIYTINTGIAIFATAPDPSTVDTKVLHDPKYLIPC